MNEIRANSEGLSPGRSPPAQQRGSGRQHATAGIRIGRKKWEKEVNKVVIECRDATETMFAWNSENNT